MSQWMHVTGGSGVDDQYPTNGAGGTSTTAADSMFGATSRVVLRGVLIANPDQVDAYILSIQNHAGTSYTGLDFSIPALTTSLANGVWQGPRYLEFPKSGILLTAGLSASWAQTGDGNQDALIFFDHA